MKLKVLFTVMTLLSSMAFAGPISSGGDEKAREFDCVAFQNVDELFAIRVRDVAGTITQVSLWLPAQGGELAPVAAVYATAKINPLVDAVQIDHEDFESNFVLSVLPISMAGIFNGTFPGTNFHRENLRMFCEEIK